MFVEPQRSQRKNREDAKSALFRRLVSSATSATSATSAVLKSQLLHLGYDVFGGDTRRRFSREHARRTHALRERAQRLTRRKDSNDRYSERAGDVQRPRVVADEHGSHRE